MPPMEVVFVLFFVIVIALILVSRYSLSDKMDWLEHEVMRLREELKRREGEGIGYGAFGAGSEGAVEAPAAAPPWKRSHSNRFLEGNKARKRPETKPPRLTQPPTDWEKFIGENLISKIGIAILVLAIGFFVKYAIDNDWIGPAGRVGVGLLCGAILIGLAHWLRRQYKAFSSVLIGGGLAVLYFTIALAYHQNIISFGQDSAFVLMLIITAFSVVLSLLYDREELAIIALVGGFVTPFLVSNGSGDYKVLFTYLLILNTGLLVIAYYKARRATQRVGIRVYSCALCGLWLITLPENTGQAVYDGGALPPPFTGCILS